MQGYCTNTQNTREAWVTTQFVTLPLGSDGCFKEKMYPVMGKKNKNKNVQVESKVAQFSRKNQNVTLHLGTDGCH